MPLTLRHILVTFGLLTIAAACSTDLTNQPKDVTQPFSSEQALDAAAKSLKEDPTNAERRAAYLAARERTLKERLGEAGQAQARGDSASADAFYRRILRLDPGHDQARAAIEALGKEARRRALLKDAKDAVALKDAALASSRLRALLAEWPNDADAKALLDTLEQERTAAAEAVLNPALQKKVSIQFKDATVKQVFDVLSADAGINFVFDKDVKADATVNVTLKDTTVKDALDTVLTASQLEASVIGHNSFLIYPNTPAKVKDYKNLIVKAFFLSNANAEEVANTLKTIIKARDIVVDKSKNLLIIRDTPDAIRVAEKLVRLQDLAHPEVMLEVEILEVNRNRLSELGVNFPAQLTLSPLASTTGGTITLRDLLNINSSTTAATIPPAVISAYATDTDVKVLANPRIRAKDRETAKILIGDRVPNITSTATSTGFVSSSVQYIDVGLKLEMTPIVSIDNEVSIKVSLEVSNITSQVTTSSGTLAYQIGTRTASTVLRLKDGENQILAGLINNEDRVTSNRIPGLSDLPIIGRLLSNVKNDARKNEIILSITPRILRNTPRQVLAALEFDSGSDTKLRSTGLSGAAPSRPAVVPGVRSTPRSGPGGAAPPPPPPGSAAPGGSSAPGVPGGGSATTSGGPPGVITANLMWLGPSQVKIGDTFQLQLQMGSSVPITSIPYTLAFDPAALEVTGVSEGDLLKQGGGQTTFSQRVDRTTGQIFISNARAGGAPTQPGAGGTGTLINLTVKALSASTGSNVQVISMSPQTGTESQVTVTLPSMYTISIAP